MSRSRRPEPSSREPQRSDARREAPAKSGPGAKRHEGARGKPRDARTGERPRGYLVPGERAVIELLQAAPERVRELWLEQGRELPRVVELARAHGIALHERERDELEALVGPGLARGVVAHARPPKEWAIEDLLERDDEGLPRTQRGHRLIVVLDGVQDPHNLGACLRSAEAAGATAVVVPRDKAVGITPVVHKASAGAAERVPFVQVANLARAMDELKEAGIWITGLAGEGKESLYDIDLRGKVALVLGGEGEGLRRLTRDKCDHLAKIPMYGGVESLNVSVATGIALFEARRQRGR